MYNSVQLVVYTKITISTMCQPCLANPQRSKHNWWRRHTDNILKQSHLIRKHIQQIFLWCSDDWWLFLVANLLLSFFWSHIICQLSTGEITSADYPPFHWHDVCLFSSNAMMRASCLLSSSDVMFVYITQVTGCVLTFLQWHVVCDMRSTKNVVQKIMVKIKYRIVLLRR